MVATIIVITVFITLLFSMITAGIMEAKKAKWTFSGDTRLQKRKFGLAMDLYGAMGIETDEAVLPCDCVHDAIYIENVTYGFLNEADRYEAYNSVGVEQDRLDDSLGEAMWDHEHLRGRVYHINMSHVVEALFKYCYPKG